MPRFYFHVHDGVEFRDAVGSDLRDVAAARVQAVQIAAELISGHHVEFWDGGWWELEVADESGHSLFKLRFEARASA